MINYSGTAGQTLTVQFTSDGGTVAAGFSLFASYSGSCVSCTAPTTQASSIVLTPTANTTATASWTRGNGNNVMVVARTAAAVNPVNGTTYTANTIYGSGSAVGGGWCVYNGPGTSVNVTGLTANTTYFFDVYEYATTATCYLTPALSGSTKTFNNGNNVLYPTAGGAVSYTQCSGIFYDNGGAGSDYNANLPALTRPVTFYPVTSGDKVVLTFTSFATESATCATDYDWMKIYNGNSTAASLINCYSTGGVTPGTITSTALDGSLTIDFKSDGTPNGAGWAASISCYTPCATVPGTSSASVTTGCGSTNTSLSLAGEGAGTIQWQTSTDGGSTWTNIAGATTDPYVHSTSATRLYRAAVTNGCTSYSTSSSYTASCPDIIHPASGFSSTTIQCGGSYLYKDPGNTGNYGNNQNGLITICPSTAGQYVNVNFTAFNTESGSDYFYVFDGGDAGAPILGIYSGNGALSGNVKATASNSSGCLSFRFYSDGGTTYSGWQGTVTCNGTPSATVPSSNPEDCQGAYTICNNGTFMGGTNNYGFNELPDQWNSCLGNAGARGEYESTWAVFSPATSGTIGFSITPTSACDYDWAIWGPYASLECPAFNNDVPIRCSSSSLASTGNPGTTGLIAPAADVIEQNGEYGGGANENGKLSTMNVLAGEIYVMMLDNWDANTTPFALNWNLTNGATLDCTPVLPVTMSGFNNSCKNGNTLLEWTTASEVNNDYFAIERSDQSFEFYEIGRVKGSGNSNISNSYSFLDPAFNNKTTYYRIKQVDYNGEFRYHRIVASSCYKTEFEVVNHQLTSDKLDLTVNSFENENVTIYLYDLQGRLIIESSHQLIQGNNKINLNHINIESGIYLINIVGEVHHYQTKLIRK